MSHSTPRLTPELQGRIVSFVRAGGHAHIAAEAAGISRRLLQSWLHRGNQRRAQPLYRAFATEVRAAAAQAQLRAEIAIFDKRPLDWLKSGPGKETSRRPGWSAAPRARTATRTRDSNPLAERGFQRFCAQLLDSLTPFPEARASLADKVPEWTQSRRKRTPRAEL